MSDGSINQIEYACNGLPALILLLLQSQRYYLLLLIDKQIEFIVHTVQYLHKIQIKYCN